MKTTFSRLFALFAAVILLCLLLLGVSFRVMLRDYLEDEKQQTLYDNASTMADLAAAFDGALDVPWGAFHIALTSAAQVADVDAVICDPAGTIRICGCREFGCVHRGKVVDEALVAQVMEEGELFLTDALTGLYEQPQYMQAMALRARNTGEPVGVLLVTAPQKEIGGVVTQSTVLFFYVAVIVLVVAMIASYILSRNQARSIGQVAAAAVRLGHGELDTRVAVGGRNTAEADELAMAFNTMAESLSRAEKQRQDFVANVSHELKTPMTTISGFVDGILDGTVPEDRHRHYMQLVSDEVRRLSRLVRGMLDVSRLQAQGVTEEKKRRFDLCENIGQVLISFERRVNAKGLLMDVQLPDRSVWVKADQDGITQVVYNLVDNAVKFCQDGGRLSIRLAVEGGKARVSVENTGATVPAEELPLLFDRFHKTDKSRSADPEGVGLGLYIVKTILNSHGEDIFVTSHEGVTAFTFTLTLVR